MAKLTLTDGTIFEGTTEELIALTEQFSGKVADPVAEELRVGDRVEIVDARNSTYNDLADGDIGVVTDTDGPWANEGKPYQVATEDDYDHFPASSLRKVAKPSVKPISVGDIVVITANTNGSRNKVGDIGEVVTKHPLSAKVDVPSRPNASNVKDNWTKYNEMRHATLSEIAEYEQTIKQSAKESVFTQAGRKPNEYHEGDIVRIVVASCVNNDGDIGEVTEEATDGTARVQVSGKSNRGNWESISHIEPIVFAESRLDLRK